MSACHQMEQHVVAADVDDKRDGGLERGDVGKVLIGPDADVCARSHCAQTGDDRLKAFFV